jgi:glycosyltransferase involved in cell wall biosynthesis
VITPTYRSENLKICLDTFKRQTYPNRELIIVFNGNQLPSLTESGLDQPMENVSIIAVPGDLFAGACLNMGHFRATGRYCFRMDDDDLYGPEYISDMMLSATALDADLFGKPPAPLVFEGDQTVYLRKNSLPFCIVPYQSAARNDIWIGGNSISGRHQFFKQIQYDDWSFDAADSSLMYRLSGAGDGFFAIADSLNLVAERRSDQTSHTWKIEASQFKNTDTVSSVQDLMI